MENTRTLADVYTELGEPFPIALVEVKPGATTKDKTKALALAYCDARAYQDRLDVVIGPDNWQVCYKPLPFGTAVLCRLSLLGIVREDVGECDPTDPNAYTSAVAQAFKRACSAFGLGRDLYTLPQTWAAYDEQKKAFVDAASVARSLYHRAGLPLE